MVAQLEFAVGKTLPVDIRCVREQVAEVLILATCAPEFAIEATIHKFSDGTPLNEKPSIIVLRTLDKPEREASSRPLCHHCSDGIWRLDNDGLWILRK